MKGIETMQREQSWIHNNNVDIKKEDRRLMQEMEMNLSDMYDSFPQKMFETGD